MQDKNTTESTFFQLLGPILSQDLWQKISRNVESVDKYIKKLKTVQLVQLLFGKSKAAVVNQLVIALITYCLMMLVKYRSAYQGPLLDIQRLLITCLYEPFTSFVQKLHRKGPPTKGRQRQDSKRVYVETLNQVLSGEMDDLFYSNEIF